MSQEPAPDPAVPTGPASAMSAADPDEAPEDGSAADDQGLRWAALLAAFIDDMQAPPAGGPAEPAGGAGPSEEPSGPSDG
ncbi:hypothetical protein ACIGJO_32675 [Streptomyces sp. NPDC079020]|uniref:hypothetical protein n=1 Tax=Streptomyces sp. NPDC079020 TaxID=3365722 RepID=UPI0037D68E95